MFDIETGIADVKLNLNPEGWIPGVTKEKDWLVRNCSSYVAFALAEPIRDQQQGLCIEA